MMTRGQVQLAAVAALLASGAAAAFFDRPDPRHQTPTGRREVVFWHFWGGEDRDVVERIVDRFNHQHQNEYFVRAVAMPGANLDLKFFLALTGGEPPDLLNQDDPVVADWAHRQALVPIDELATAAEIDELPSWLLPAASKLGSYDGRLYALCNGLDVRALYYNKTMLSAHGLAPPETLAELDAIAETIAPPGAEGSRASFGYLPDPRRLWAWGIVFGGRFYDPQTGEITADGEPIVRALDWITGYRRRYGAEQVAAFRVGDQSLPGATFPLLEGRYAIVMDGQWRVRDIARAQQAQSEQGRPVTEYGVCPLPPPAGGRRRAGWVNGNFFVVPRGAKNPDGAWAFMKFWSGFGGHEAEAARICVAGGWIPPSQAVVDQPAFQQHLEEQPLLATLVQLAAGPDQVPTPVIPGAGQFYKEIVNVAETAMYDDSAPPAGELLRQAARRIRRHVSAAKGSSNEAR